MAPFLTSNHERLIKDCYPADLTANPLPSASSNHLGKLTFYAAGRPKKLPKVAGVLLERAEKEGRSSSGVKGRGGLAVTLDVLKGLVTECRTEMRCFADQALRAVELGLTRREGQRRDPHMEARAASLVSCSLMESPCLLLTLTSAVPRHRNIRYRPLPRPE